MRTTIKVEQRRSEFKRMDLLEMSLVKIFKKLITNKTEMKMKKRMIQIMTITCLLKINDLHLMAGESLLKRQKLSRRILRELLWEMIFHIARPPKDFKRLKKEKMKVTECMKISTKVFKEIIDFRQSKSLPTLTKSP